MKEVRFFYVPDAENRNELPDDEAMHALRVLRLRGGDEMFLMDGVGNYYRAEVDLAATRRCTYKILEKMPQERQWRGNIHLVVSPTKTLDRIEWMVEKSTEVGVDEFSFVACKNSERRLLKSTRLDKIITAAVKQSHKAWRPQIHEMDSLKHFLAKPIEGRKFIAHCYNEIPRTFLMDELNNSDSSLPTTVLIGPEGDFTIDEVRAAMDAGFVSIDLGSSRLRTETAGMVAATMMHLNAEVRKP